MANSNSRKRYKSELIGIFSYIFLLKPGLLASVLFFTLITIP